MGQTDTSPSQFIYSKSDDPILCATTGCTGVPKGVKPACYATQDSDYPKQEQFCGFVQDNVLYGAQGCCDPPCPSNLCPSIQPRTPSPLPLETTSTSLSFSSFQNNLEPLSKLVKLLLLTFAILIVLALIFT